MFQGWFRLDGENKIPVVSGAVSGVSGKTVRVDAVFAEFSYVLFMSKDGSAVVHTAQGSSGNAVSDADLNTAAEMVNLSLGPTEAVVGWSSTQGGEAGAGCLRRRYRQCLSCDQDRLLGSSSIPRAATMWLPSSPRTARP